MAASDSDFKLSDNELSSPPAHNLRKTRSTPPPESANKNQRVLVENGPPKRQVRLPTNLKAIAQLQDRIKKRIKGKDVDGNLSLRVMSAVLTLQRRYLEEKKKNGLSKKRTSPARVQQTVVSMFSISTRTYTSIVTNYLKGRTVYRSGKEGGGRSGNRDAKMTRIERTNKNQILIRNFVREKRMRRERVTARQIVDHLWDEEVLFLRRSPDDGEYDPKEFATAYRAMQQHLEFLGY